MEVYDRLGMGFQVEAASVCILEGEGSEEARVVVVASQVVVVA